MIQFKVFNGLLDKNMNTKNFTFATDTATMCAFDLTCLKHRLDDDADWWTTSVAELTEVNHGSVAFLGLGEDGIYRVIVEVDVPDAQVKVNLRVPSGKFFVGAGEEVTSDGLEPEAIRGGAFIEIEPGNYTLLAKREGKVLTIALVAGSTGINKFENPVRV